MRILVRALGLLALSAGAALAQDTKLVVLGTGTPNADPDRSGPALAVVRGTRSYLIDAGPGIVRRASAAATRHGLSALEPPQLRTLFLTHLHSDHTVGLPDVIYTSWVMERTAKFKVFGPPGTTRMVDKLAEAYAEDIAIRTNGLERNVPNAWKVDARDVRPGSG